MGQSWMTLACHSWSQERLAEAVDRSKGSAGPVDVVAVGGGSFLIAENLPGTSRVLVPQHASCANAVGAASAQVSGTVDLIVQLEGRDRARVLAEVRRKAEELAVAAGADPSTLELLEQEETPLAYLPGATTRVHIKAVGQLAEPRATDIGGMQLPLFSSTGSEATREASLPPAEPRTAAPQPPPIATGLVGSQGNRPGMSEAEFDEEGAWLIGPRDVDAISLGCGILGSGGGGSPYSACIRLKLLLESRPGNRLRVIQPSAVPDDGLVVFASYMGAPTVSIEKLDSGQALVAAQAVLRAAGTGKQVVGAATDEIGGGNGLEGLLLALHLDVPAVDADVMGRAFPELQMCTTAINGMPMTPAACADEKGSVVVVQSAPSPLALEEILRPVCTAMGCIAGLATRPLTGKELKAVAVPQTLSCAWRLGRAVLAARAAQCDTATAVCEQYHNGRVVFRGKVIDVDRRTAGGFARGQLSIRGASGTEWEGAVMTIEFQNENLLARLTTNSKTATKGSVSSAVVACVPDLICCLETPTGRALQTEELRYGLLVSVVALPAPNQLRTARAMLVVGPRAFGYPDVEYTPVGQHIPAPAVAVDLRPDAE